MLRPEIGSKWTWKKDYGSGTLFTVIEVTRDPYSADSDDWLARCKWDNDASTYKYAAREFKNFFQRAEDALQPEPDIVTTYVIGRKRA